MAKVFPIKAVHYNSNQVALQDVVIPPYDVISPDEAIGYRNRSPYNFSHIILPNSPDETYDQARTLLEKWKKQSIFQSATEDAFFIYQQQFSAMGKNWRRNTLMCAVQLHEFSDRVVLPHERTHGAPKADRLKLLKKTQHNLSPLFGMVKDSENWLGDLLKTHSQKDPLLSFHQDDGVTHRIWKLPPSQNQALTTFFESQSVYIIDGHHRYESSLAYANELGVAGKDHPAARMFFAIGTTTDPAMVVYPTHRTIHGIEPSQFSKEAISKVFDLQSASFEDIATLTKTPQTKPSFGLSYYGELYHCLPKNWESRSSEFGKALNSLSVLWSDAVLMGEVAGLKASERGNKVKYNIDAEWLWQNKSHSEILLLLPPISVGAIAAVSDEGGYMPQKSTYFYPKLAAGLIIREL